MPDPTPHALRRQQAMLHRITRRHFFPDCGVGVGKIALASLLCGSARALAAPPRPLTRSRPRLRTSRRRRSG